MLQKSQHFQIDCKQVRTCITAEKEISKQKHESKNEQARKAYSQRIEKKSATVPRTKGRTETMKKMVMSLKMQKNYE